jgi:hypothetical protein
MGKHERQVNNTISEPHIQAHDLFNFHAERGANMKFSSVYNMGSVALVALRGFVCLYVYSIYAYIIYYIYIYNKLLVLHDASSVQGSARARLLSCDCRPASALARHPPHLPGPGAQEWGGCGPASATASASACCPQMPPQCSAPAGRPFAPVTATMACDAGP